MLRPFRFRLVTMFVAVSVIAGTLAALQNWYLVPKRTGTMSHAICYASDFRKLVSSRPGQKAGDFAMHSFDAASPPELFRDFSPTPHLWPMAQPISQINGYSRNATGFPSFCRRNRRPTDSPVGGYKDVLDMRYAVTDEFAFGANFEESVIPPKRYSIDCVFWLTLGMPNAGPPSPTVQPISSRLRYTGPAHGGLLVFSRPIDDELVQLIILDLR